MHSKDIEDLKALLFVYGSVLETSRTTNQLPASPPADYMCRPLWRTNFATLMTLIFSFSSQKTFSSVLAISDHQADEEDTIKIPDIKGRLSAILGKQTPLDDAWGAPPIMHRA